MAERKWYKYDSYTRQPVYYEVIKPVTPEKRWCERCGEPVDGCDIVYQPEGMYYFLCSSCSNIVDKEIHGDK